MNTKTPYYEINRIMCLCQAGLNVEIIHYRSKAKTAHPHDKVIRLSSVCGGEHTQTENFVTPPLPPQHTATDNFVTPRAIYYIYCWEKSIGLPVWNAKIYIYIQL